jgi:phage virion morphogenesis protein
VAGAVRVEVDLKGLAKTEEGLADILGRLKNKRELMARIGQYMVRSTQMRINKTKLDPDGVPWAPLTQATEEIKARDGVHPQDILFHWGTLANSIYVKWTTDSTTEVTANTTRYGASKNYAPYMQYGVGRTGGRIKGKSIPARPFMGISEQNKKIIMKMVNSYVMGKSGDEQDR